jgi:hypothetical protein
VKKHLVYIACHDSAWAEALALRVRRNPGLEVCSTWHHEPLARTRSIPAVERYSIAARDFCEIGMCHTLILISGPGTYPGGKFVEAGYAIAKGKQVVVLGRLENMMLYHPRVVLYEWTLEGAAGFRAFLDEAGNPEGRSA